MKILHDLLKKIEILILYDLKFIIYIANSHSIVWQI
ncbi:MAG: hypothetical protein Satyrvirus2_28 [Satyrvirus sp.]|uniref:Uncharacterized protein n=1 Tax=Satyrvirus sp. TaxID=2487771 RepID=A0A3G5ACY3_9VIRU|nr:MAG: hypothetical protein Satyrvirus2_28 [Satyrvirus sp.]